VDQRVAGVDQRGAVESDDDARPVGAGQADAAAERVRQATDALADLDVLAELHLEVEDAGPPGAHPAAVPALHAGLWRRLDRVDHAKGSEDPADALDAGRDRLLVEAERLAALVEQHRRTLLAGSLAQRPVADPGVQHHRCTERLGEVAGLRVVEVGADLRQVDPPVGTGVEVDPELATGDDLGHEQVGDAAGERAACAARERPVEVAPVGQVAVAGHEPENVDDRYGDERAAEGLRRHAGEHAPDDLDAHHLIAVEGGVDPDRRPGLATVDDPGREAHVGAGHQPGDRELDLAGEPRSHPHGAHRERLTACGHQYPRFFRRTARAGIPPT
jgi:hypothetical protein